MIHKNCGSRIWGGKSLSEKILLPLARHLGEVLIRPPHTPLLVGLCKVQGKKRVGKTDCVARIQPVRSHGPTPPPPV